MTDPQQKAPVTELIVELYRSLRSESSVYIEKVPALWLQKFVLVGALLAFLLTQKKSFEVVGEGEPAETAFDAALVAIPILAALLDAKIMEYGLHARIISRFIEEEFSTDDVIRRWERTLWGYTPEPDQRGMVKLRSATTVIVTVAPTMLIMALDAVLFYVRRQEWWILAVGAVAILAYLVGAALVTRKVWPSSN